jgi:RHS repeat-associated protein
VRVRLQLLIGISERARRSGNMCSEYTMATPIARTKTGIGVVKLVLLSAALIVLQANSIGVAQGTTQGSSVAGQAATIVSGGLELLTGGIAGESVSANTWIRDPQTGAVGNGPALVRARAWHTATMLPDGRVLIVGGVDSAGRDVPDVERLDLVTGTSEILPLTWTASAHTATLLNGHEVLLAGGLRRGQTSDEADVLNLDTGQISTAGTLPMPRAHHRAALLADGRVELWGGRGENRQLTDSGAMFDPASQAFTQTFSPESDGDLLSVAGSEPIDGANDVTLQPRILLRFSKLVRLETVRPQTVVLAGPAGFVAAQVLTAEARRLAFVTPTARLEPRTTYILTINGVRDEAGQECPSFTLTFTTGDDRERGLPNPDDELFDPSTNGLWQRWRMDRPESPWQRMSPLTGPPGVTALSGQALRLNGSPLAGVTMRLAGQTAITDATGRFLLTNESLSMGWHTLTIDGRKTMASGATYGRFDRSVRITPGKTNVLPDTIWMPKIDTRHAVRISSPTTTETVVTTPLIPGLELHLAPGTVITDDDGRVAHEVSITPIPVDRTPFPLPAGVDVPIYFTIQPGGAYVVVTGTRAHVGARLIYPNYRGRRPGTRMDFWHYEPDAGKGWYVYGGGQVSANGQQVVPDPGVSLYTFTGAMVGPPGLAPGKGPLPGNKGKGGDPVDLQTGLFVLQKTDLSLQDVLPLRLRRTYRPNDTISRAFGIGATHDYDIFLVGTTFPYTYVDLILPDGGRVHYDRISSGTSYLDAVYEHTSSPTRFFKSRITWNGTGWNLDLKDGSRITFPDGYSATRPMQGAAKRIQDRHGNSIVLTRDANANLTRITSPNGRYVDLTYDGSYRITQARDNIGRTVQYTYDASGRLWKVTDAAGGVTQYTYDGSHRMLTVTDARGTTYLTNQYDAAGRAIQQTQADGSTFTFAYTLDPNGAITQTDVTDPRGQVRRVTFGAAGYLASDTRAVGQPQERTNTYSRQSGTNLVTAITDGLGRQTTYAYDDRANVTSITRLAGTSSALATTYTYESTFNQLASITDPLTHTITLTHDSSGNLTSIADALGNTTSLTYNAGGQPVSMTTAEGTMLFGYDSGDVTSLTDPLGRITSRYVDAAGRGVRVSNPLGQATTCAYDEFNNVKNCTDSAGGQTSFTYDANSNLLAVTDALNHATTYTYDNMDRVAARTDPLNRVQSYTYDPNGNVHQMTDRKGQVRTYSYDALDRLHSVTYHDTSTKTYTYDAGDRVTQISDSAGGTISRTYDLLNRLTQEATAEGSVSYTYDAASRRASMTIDGQPAVSYSYDAANRLTNISSGGSAVGLSYDAANRRTALTLPNGVAAAYAYDALSELTGITYTLGSTIAGDLTYTYDAAGQRIAVGGSLARTGLPSALSAATYDAANQIASWESTSFSYDLNGNLASDGINAYTWNVRNQLVGVTGSASASFAYDPVGRRRSKTVGANTTNSLYDGWNSVQELAGGSPSANLLTGLRLDETFTRTDSSGTRALLTDALGSTFELADASGTLQTHYSYEPFGGTSTSGGASTNVAQYTGRDNDGTGLYYYRARFYSPTWQRFIAEDPIGFSGGSVNLYAYARGNPLRYTDPLGLWGVGIGIGGLVGIGSGVTGGVTVTVTSNGDIGLQLTGGFEAIGGATASVGIGPQLSNAQTLGDLSGPFADFGGSVGELFPVFGADMFGGQGQTGNTVYGGNAQVGWGAEVGPGLIPGVEVHGGVTWTETYGCNIFTWTCGHNGSNDNKGGGGSDTGGDTGGDPGSGPGGGRGGKRGTGGRKG